MSDRIERAKALGEALQADEAFAAEFKKLVQSRDTEALIALAGQKGVTLLPEDFAPEGAKAPEGAEVDDAELEAVAGGYSWEEFMGDVACWAYMLMATAAR